MKNKTYLVGIILLASVSGCNFSPLSPTNRPNIRNNGDVGDIKNNQQGLMVELMNLKNRMDVMAQEIENIQNGFINHNNKNSGIQIFQGDGGLIAGLSSIGILAIVALAYKLKSDKYKKTAELFGKQIKNMNNDGLERSVLASALANKVEMEAFRILRDQSKS